MTRSAIGRPDTIFLFSCHLYSQLPQLLNRKSSRKGKLHLQPPQSHCRPPIPQQWPTAKPSSPSQSEHHSPARPHFSPDNASAPNQQPPPPQPSHTRPSTAASIPSQPPKRPPRGPPKQPSPTSSTRHPLPPPPPQNAISSTVSCRTNPVSCPASPVSWPQEVSTLTPSSSATLKSKTCLV